MAVKEVGNSVARSGPVRRRDLGTVKGRRRGVPASRGTRNPVVLGSALRFTPDEWMSGFWESPWPTASAMCSKAVVGIDGGAECELVYRDWRGRTTGPGQPALCNST